MDCRSDNTYKVGAFWKRAETKPKIDINGAFEKRAYKGCDGAFEKRAVYN